jgi:hypothetical protein
MALTTLFDKFTGDFTSYDNTKIVVASADYKVNYYRGWFCVINGVEYEITGNSKTEIFFNNSLSAIGNFEIVFIGREFLKRIDSDFNDSVKIPDNLISNKYLMANDDLSSDINSKFRLDRTLDFEPLDNLLNLDAGRTYFARYIASEIFSDLNGKFGSSFYIEKSDRQDHKMIESKKQCLEGISLDRNKNNKEDLVEKKEDHSIHRFRR